MGHLGLGPYIKYYSTLDKGKIRDAEAHPEYNDSSYVENNLAVMHVYFKNLHFMQHNRGELFGPVDFVSNIGGLLGLCMGFSAISAVEFIYYFTMRLLLNVK